MDRDGYDLIIEAIGNPLVDVSPYPEAGESVRYLDIDFRSTTPAQSILNNLNLAGLMEGSKYRKREVLPLLKFILGSTVQITYPGNEKPETITHLTFEDLNT